MSIQQIATGVVHEVPKDLYDALIVDTAVLERWEDLTPLARNEWICWVVTNKKPETRKKHIDQMADRLLKGQRRPCCWAGCIHRK
jgi:uncharacterized protein YdeI (YjbR/CyaY-like superfamily)